MRRNTDYFIYAILATFVLGIAISIIIREYEYNDCDTTLVLKSGEVFKGSAINDYRNLEVIDLIDCKGKHIVFRKNTIKTIKEE